MLALRDEVAWAALWAEHTVGQEPDPPVPEIDLVREMAIVFFWGEKPSSGYEAEIVEVILRSDLLQVRVGVRLPSTQAIVLPVLTQPFHLVRVPRSDLPVEFETVEAPAQSEVNDSRG